MRQPCSASILTLLFAAAIAWGYPVSACENPIEQDYKVLHKSYPLSNGKYKGVAILSMDVKAARVGDRFKIEITFKNTADQAYDVLDPHLVSRGVFVAVLAIYDAKRDYIGNLLTPVYGTSVTTDIGFSEWCRIEPCEAVYRPVYCTAGIVGGTNHIHSNVGLPPGTYYIQAVYQDRFASSCPWYQPANPCGPQNGVRSEDGEIQLPPERVREMQKHNPQQIAQALKEWREKYDGSELFRSNILEIEFLPQPVEAPKPR